MSETATLRNIGKATPPPPKPFTRRGGSAKLLASALGHLGLVVVAPIGYGKTTLAAEWTELLEASKAANLRYVPLARNAISTSSFRSSLEAIIDEADGETLICLDGCELLPSNSYVALEEAMASSPTYVHWALLCKEEPDISLTKMLAEGKIVPAGGLDLALSVDESIDYLRALPGMRELSEADEAETLRWSEGWPLGLRELGTMRKSDPRDESAPAFDLGTPTLTRIFVDVR